MLIAGFFMVFASNGLNTWAIHYIPTNQSALLNGTAAFWIAGLGVFGRRGHPLTRWAVLGMIIGFAGTALMMIPKGWLACVLRVCWRSWGCSPRAAPGRSAHCTTAASTRTRAMFLDGHANVHGRADAADRRRRDGDPAHWSPNPAGLAALGVISRSSARRLAYTAYGWLSLNAAPALLCTPARSRYLRHRLPGGVAVSRRASVQCATRRHGDHYRRRVLLDPAGGLVIDPKTLGEPKAQ